jgi:hypothetical protein
MRKRHKKNKPNHWPKPNIGSTGNRPGNAPLDHTGRLTPKGDGAASDVPPSHSLPPQEDVDDASLEAAYAAQAEEVPEPSPEEAPETLTFEIVARMWEQLNVAKQQYLAANEAALQRLRRAEERETRATDREAAAERATKKESELRALEAQVVERDRRVREAEVNASYGFAKQNQQALALLEAEKTRLERTIAELAKRESEAKATASAAQAECERQWAEGFEQRKREGEAALQGLRDKAEADRHAARREREAAIAAQERAAEAETTFELRVTSRVNERLRLVQAELDGLRASEEDYKAEIVNLQRKLAQRQLTELRIEGRAPADILRERDDLAERCAWLERELSQRLPADANEELRYLRDAQREWREKYHSLAERLQRSEANRVELQGLAWTAEQHQTEVRLLEQKERVLKESIEGLESTIQAHLKRTSKAKPFAACSAMDEEPELQRKPRLYPLKKLGRELVHYVRHHMATGAMAEDGRAELDPLYYEERDVRAFLGGLAMSRLLLLQGISGIGKTSLPTAVARVFGGDAAIIPVQAGWRDKHDLLGHYNTFDGRFRESSFLQALYRAGTPQYEDRLCLIVLDEMNLSHPEQFFADFLVAIGSRSGSGMIRPVDSAVDGALPSRFVAGNALPLPSNVWFVGTANHDPTTHAFAEKTYDRSHVLELPKTPKVFTAEDVGEARGPFSVSRLQALFDDAVGYQEREVKAAEAFMFGDLRRWLADDFDLGLGGRMQGQLRRYTAAVAAMGGTASEAADHMLATRVLRQLRGRLDVDAGQLRTLQDKLLALWDKQGAEAPLESHEVLDSISRELEGASGRGGEGE